MPILRTAICSRQIFKAVTLMNAYLGSTDLRESLMMNANLQKAYMAHSDMDLADFSGANLSFAYLAFADGSGANFSGADLSYADLVGVDFTDANLQGSNLMYVSNYDSDSFIGATYDRDTILGPDMDPTELGMIFVPSPGGLVLLLIPALFKKRRLRSNCTRED